MTLTRRQTTVLEYIRDHIAVNGYSPSVRDVGAWLGVSIHAAEQHLIALEKKGAIQRKARVARSIRIVAIP